MKEGTRFWISVLALVGLGMSGGIVWRVELEKRFGWDGLAWTSGFYWTVPVGVMLFITWASWVTPVPNRAAFVATLLAFALPGYLAANLAIYAEFGRFGPSFLIALSIWLLIPLAFCALCRLLGAPITLVKTIGSAFLFVLSWPIATFVRDFFEQRGADDFIHALKSGFVIPFLVVSLGLPLVPVPAGIFRRRPVQIVDEKAGQVS